MKVKITEKYWIKIYEPFYLFNGVNLSMYGFMVRTEEGFDQESINDNLSKQMNNAGV